MNTEPTIPGTGSDEPPKGAAFMNALRWALFAGLLLLAVVSITMYIAGHSREGGTTKAAAAARYRCPMHPSYTSDRPGECPICGMTLEPIPPNERGGGVGAPPPQGTAAVDGGVPGLAPVQISPERIQLIGVRTARVARRAVGRPLELVGFVAPDEGSLRRVQIRASGWIQSLHVNRTGEVVRAGEPLLTIYSPELFQSEQEYLIELQAQVGVTMDSKSPPPPPTGSGPHEGSALAAGRERMRLLGVPADEMLRLDRERTAQTALVLRSPVTGTVLERNVVEGQSINANSPLFTIADLSRVWVLADLYEMDFGRVKVGDRATFRIDAIPNRAFQGRVEFVYPTVSNETRTLKIRFALANPGGVLRPGMYGRVAVQTAEKSALAVPADAIVNAGEREYVFLVRGGGRFEPRQVTVGSGDGEWVPVLAGLAEGDSVVAGASFLIDSESRLRSAVEGVGRAANPPPVGGGPGHVHGTTR